MEEIQHIRERYARRKRPQDERKGAAAFIKYNEREKERIFSEILKNRFGKRFNKHTLMEVGAGTGNNIRTFLNLGFLPENIWANELLPDRLDHLTSRFPEISVDAGDATGLSYSGKFDVVLQSTVFTSILDAGFKQKFARKMLEMVKPDGIILWYDFVYDNPKNPDVRGIPKKEVKALFQEASSIRFRKVTLAPPIGRRVYGMYNFFNFVFPFLRTHIIAEICK